MENKLTKKNIEDIAGLLTDDPDIFNEMAVSTGAIAAPIGIGNVPTKTRKRKKKLPVEDDGELEDKPIKKFHADPVTGQPKNGEILYSDTQSEEIEKIANVLADDIFSEGDLEHVKYKCPMCKKKYPGKEFNSNTHYACAKCRTSSFQQKDQWGDKPWGRGRGRKPPKEDDEDDPIIHHGP